MKAVVYARYGPPEVLRLDDIERPRPSDDQVLIKVRAVFVNASDWEMLRGKPLYARIGGPPAPPPFAPISSVPPPRAPPRPPPPRSPPPPPALLHHPRP